MPNTPKVLLDLTRLRVSICTRLDSTEDAGKLQRSCVLCAARPKSNLVVENAAWGPKIILKLQTLSGLSA